MNAFWHIITHITGFGQIWEYLRKSWQKRILFSIVLLIFIKKNNFSYFSGFCVIYWIADIKTNDYSLIAEVRSMAIKAAKSAISGRQTVWLLVRYRAQIVSATAAKLALKTGERRLDGHSVARLQMGDLRTDSYDQSRGFVSQHVWFVHNEVSDESSLPECDICATDATAIDVLIRFD